MQSNLKRAKELLSSSNYTCVVTNGDNVLTSIERGVKPLLSWFDSGYSFKGYCAADKVVGRAAAYLYVVLGIDFVYADVMSKKAAEVLEEHAIDYSYGTLVDAIINRTNTGFCPMEQAVSEIFSPSDAITAIRETLKRLS